MIPYLFSADHSGAFTGSGLGVLADTTRWSTTHQLNGQDELRMEYPVGGALFDELSLRAIILAKVEKRGLQPYRIYRITKPLNGVVTVYARHLVYDLAGIVVEPFAASGIQAALAGLTTHAMTTNPFTFSSTRSTAAAFKVTVPGSVWSLMAGQQGSLLDVYGGEYAFDNWTVRLENRIGVDAGVSVRYGVNMTDLEQDANCADCYTGVVAYWQSESTVVYSDVQDASGTYGYTKVLTVDMSQRWDTAPSVAQLNAAATAYITANQIGVPKVAWKVGFVPLAQTEEYKDVAILEQVGLGDTVGVHFERLGVDATARVNAIEWDGLLERYISVSLGSVKATLADTIAQQIRELDQVPTQIRTFSEQITADILGAKGGSVRLLDTNDDSEPDTLYVADNPDPAQAVKVWRFNYEGWAASSNGYNGPFTMAATLNSGIVADYITAGVLTAITIRSSSGNFTIDLDSGVLSTSDSVTYAASNYAQADITRILGIVNGSITPTSADYTKYDFYQDGRITLADLLIAQRLVNTGEDLTLTWQAKVEPGSRGNAFSVYLNGQLKTKVGVGSVQADMGIFPVLESTTFKASEVNVTGQIITPYLTLGGTALTRKVIGYFVSGASGSSRASCFIPAGVTGAYQISSDDWYTSFTIDASGTVTRTGGASVTLTSQAVYNF